MENKQPLVSVIVPIFNVEPYIRECLTSIQNQTYTNLEIICVNDGSTDHSGVIARSYRAGDERIAYYSKENGGLSSARNVGLKHAAGDYIVFVDSDDILEPSAVDEMIRAIRQENADILVFGAELFPQNIDPEHERIVSRYLSPPNRVYYGADIVERALFEEASCNIFAWNKMYRASLFQHGIQFPEHVKLGEDRCFLFDIFPYAKCVCLKDMKLYRYRQKRETSLTGMYENRQFDRARWKIVILKYIFANWYENAFISETARERLVVWSANYIERSIQRLHEDERSEIKSKFDAIVQSTRSELL